MSDTRCNYETQHEKFSSAMVRGGVIVFAGTTPVAEAIIGIAIVFIGL